MMKKLLVLSLVLAMAGISSAALSLVSLAPNQAVVSSDTALAYNAYLTVEITGATYEVVPFAGAGDNPSILSEGDYGTDSTWYFLTAAGNPGTVAAGEHFLITLIEGPSTRIELYDGTGMIQIGQAITLIPEPMTMGLLGLGALFLRRRK